MIHHMANFFKYFIYGWRFTYPVSNSIIRVGDTTYFVGGRCVIYEHRGYVYVKEYVPRDNFTYKMDLTDLVPCSALYGWTKASSYEMSYFKENKICPSKKEIEAYKKGVQQELSSDFKIGIERRITELQGELNTKASQITSQALSGRIDSVLRKLTDLENKLSDISRDMVVKSYRNTVSDHEDDEVRGEGGEHD